MITKKISTWLTTLLLVLSCFPLQTAAVPSPKKQSIEQIEQNLKDQQAKSDQILAKLQTMTKPTPLTVPTLTARVMDLAGLFTDVQKADIEQKLIKFEKENPGAQIAVLTIKSLEGENLESYSIKVANAWGLGSKKGNNGILILVALKEKLVRIEVGRGFEEKLTDIKTGKIIDNIIVPNYRNQQYYTGTMLAISNIIKVVQSPKSQLSTWHWFENFLAVAFFIAMLIYLLYGPGDTNNRKKGTGSHHNHHSSGRSGGFRGGGGSFSGGGSSGRF